MSKVADVVNEPRNTRTFVRFALLVGLGASVAAGACDTAPVIVTTDGVDSIVVATAASPTGVESLEISVGDTVQLTAVATNAIGGVSAAVFTFSSLDPAIASVSGTGLVRGHAEGMTTVVVSADGVSVTLPVTVLEPIVIPPPPSGLAIVSVVAGAAHACAVAADGAAYCWGSNDAGEIASLDAGPEVCGQGGFETNCFPTATSLDRADISAMSLGDSFSCAITAGDVVCRGLDGLGQLGDGFVGSINCFISETNQTQPCTPGWVPVSGAPALEAITSGRTHSCGRAAAGDSVCWGSNVRGELGFGDVDPAQVDEATPVAGAFGFSQVTGGRWFTCAIEGVAGAYCWGTDAFGQVGNANVPDTDCLGFGCFPAPEAVAGGSNFVEIAAGYRHACARSETGEIQCWGSNERQQMGLPAGVTGGSGSPGSAVSGGHLFEHVVAGRDHTCALDDSGAAWCWGADDFGQLGDGSADNGDYAPRPVTGGHTFSSLAAGDAFTCGLTVEQTVYCWGRNRKGQLGNGGHTSSPTSTPTRVLGLPE